MARDGPSLTVVYITLSSGGYSMIYIYIIIYITNAVMAQLTRPEME